MRCSLLYTHMVHERVHVHFDVLAYLDADVSVVCVSWGRYLCVCLRCVHVHLHVKGMGAIQNAPF